MNPPSGGVHCRERQGPHLGLAEDLVLLGHDPVTGRPRIPTDVLRSAVAGGLLADLFRSGHLHLVDGNIVQAGNDGPVPIRPGGQLVWQKIHERPDRDIAYWVGHLQDVSNLVIAGLVRSGLLRQLRVRNAGSWWRRTSALTPCGPVFARARTRELGLLLIRRTPLTERTMTLAALIDAAGLLPVIVHAAGIATITDLSIVTPVRTRIRHAFHRAATPELVMICTAVAATTDRPHPHPTP